MMKRLVWMGTGYVAGATSSWWVQRKVRRTAERVLPTAVRREVVGRAADARDRARERAAGSAVGQSLQRTLRRERPADDAEMAESGTPRLSIVGAPDERWGRQQRANRLRR